jgi:hypothetical protein
MRGWWSEPGRLIVPPIIGPAWSGFRHFPPVIVPGFAGASHRPILQAIERHSRAAAFARDASGGLYVVYAVILLRVDRKKIATVLKENTIAMFRVAPLFLDQEIFE